MERQAGNGKNMDEIATPPRYVMDISILNLSATTQLNLIH